MVMIINTVEILPTLNDAFSQRYSWRDSQSAFNMCTNSANISSNFDERGRERESERANHVS